MHRKIAVILLMALALTAGGLTVGSTSNDARAQTERAGVSVLVQTDDLFADYVALTQAKSGLQQAEYAESFSQQVPAVQAFAGVGITGVLYQQSSELSALFEGSRSFVHYGLLEFPADYPINASPQRAEYGVLAYLTTQSLVLAFVDLSLTSEIVSFAIIPRNFDQTALFPSIDLRNERSILTLLDLLPTFNFVTAPTPPDVQPDFSFSANCVDGLATIRTLNVGFEASQILYIAENTDGPLFEISVEPTNTLVIESLTSDSVVETAFTTSGQTSLGILAGSGASMDTELEADMTFSLLVTTQNTRACVIGTTSVINGAFTLTGQLQANE